MIVYRTAQAAVAAAAIAIAAPAFAEGFLVGRMEKLKDIEVGLGEAGYGVSTHTLEMETGKGYRVWIRATGAKECAFTAPEFFQHAWFRKIEVNKVELKFGRVDEIEFEQEGAAELFFTPIKPGEYTWRCRGLEEKGMTGKIVVK